MERKGGPAGLTEAAFCGMLRANLRAALTGVETGPPVGVALTAGGIFPGKVLPIWSISEKQELSTPKQRPVSHYDS